MQELSPQKLQAFLETNEKLFLFDVRGREQFDQWRVERKGGLSSLNVPYFELIEQGGKTDFRESIREALEKEFLTKLPKNQKIIVVCAKGDTSVIVAELLRELGLQSFNLSGGMKAWGSFYDQKWLVRSEKLSILQCIRVSRGCLSYVVVSEGKALVIDPLRKIDFYNSFFEQGPMQLELVLDTHAHADHISGGRHLAKQYGVPYFLHPYDGIHPMDMLPAAFSYEPSWSGKTYQIGKVKLQTLHIPGHTLGNQAFILDEKYLFCGDSLFLHSIARPDLGGQTKAWTPLHYKSLQMLAHLPDSILVLPAHFASPEEANADFTYGKTLGELKKTNQELRLLQKPLEAFEQHIAQHLPQFPPEYIDIKRVNLGLLEPTEEKAEELELGKNICALSK